MPSEEKAKSTLIPPQDITLLLYPLTGSCRYLVSASFKLHPVILCLSEIRTVGLINKCY